MKRLIIQITFFITTNLNIKGFFEGRIYQGASKIICVPGLNCYSCPGALGSCPIGSLQAVIGSLRYRISYYIIGLLALFGLAFGRLICGWLCPFGLVQDLIHRIRVKKYTVPQRLDHGMRYIKYVILIVFVILMPMFLTNDFGMARPYFCQYICPSGTLFGGIPLMISNPTLRQAAGLLFNWKAGLLFVFLGTSLFIYRPFCKYICPLGAIYAFFNKYSLFQFKIDKTKCTHCHKCEKACKMQVPVMSQPNHKECFRCGDCKKACPAKAIK